MSGIQYSPELFVERPEIDALMELIRGSFARTGSITRAGIYHVLGHSDSGKTWLLKELQRRLANEGFTPTFIPFATPTDASPGSANRVKQSLLEIGKQLVGNDREAIERFSDSRVRQLDMVNRQGSEVQP